MKRTNFLAALSMVTLLGATTAWAGGAACTGNESEASAKACPVSGATSKSASANGGQCDMAEGKACVIGANQMVYTFAVPGAECDHCAESISKALMAEKGVHCAHVDLKTHVAYIVSDKKLDKNAISKTIKTAGFKNSYRNDGKAARADLMKYMTASTAKPDACCAAKPKEKV